MHILRLATLITATLACVCGQSIRMNPRTHLPDLVGSGGSGVVNLSTNTSAYCVSTTGTNSASCSLSPTALAAYVSGGIIILKHNLTNTGAMTLAVDGLTAKSILTQDGTALAVGDITINKPKLMIFDATLNAFVVQGDGKGTTSATSTRATWALCLGVPCVVQTDVTNWYIVTNSTAFQRCYFSSKTAPVGASLAVDVKKNGTTSIFGADPKPTLASGVTGPSLFTITSPLALVAGDYLTIDITSIGTTTAGLDVTLVCSGT